VAKSILKKSVFITFEGPEGCGKSTHSKLIAKYLKDSGYDVVYTREPGGTKLGNRIRGVLLNAKNINIAPLSEVLLFEASRFELIEEVIKPALKEGKIVISDRFNDATIVYQGYAGKVPLRNIKQIESIFLKESSPDLTIVLDVSAKNGLLKIHPAKRDRMESKEISFHKRVRAGYLDLAKKNKKRIKVIKTQKTKEATFSMVKEEVMYAIQRYKRTG